MDYVVVVNKDINRTSRDIVNDLNKILGTKKIGHTGTLDPIATGVLVVCVGKYTKLVNLLTSLDKEYIATIKLGIKTDTLDITGNVLEEKEFYVDKEQVINTLNSFLGKSEQVVPAYSAVKINGKKLYEYERKNQVIDVPAREIKIHELTQISELRCVDNHYEVDLFIKCSKGFYVRSFARDLGILLGGKAIMKELRRTLSGNFDLINSVPLKDVTVDNIVPITDIFNYFDKLEVNDYIAHLAKNGVVFDERQIITDKPFYVLHNNVIIAIYEVIDVNKYKPLIIFKEIR